MIKPNTQKIILYSIISILVILVAAMSYFYYAKLKNENATNFQEQFTDDPETLSEPTYMYGIQIDSLILIEGKIERNQTFAQLLSRHNVPFQTINTLVKKSDTIFNLRTIRSGQPYVFICTTDTLPQYFIYESDPLNYILFTLGDTLHVSAQQKTVINKRRVASGIIESNLWNSMIENGINPIMSIELSEIYAWSIDFFGLQKHDHFSVIYDEQYVDTIPIGIGHIYSVLFNHQQKDFYATSFMQDEQLSFFDENGESLQRAFLKAPLRFNRISSRFSGSRLHPVLKIRRPHYGIDYAAPSGTPVFAVGDGTVIEKKYTKQGGNTLKIKHNSVYTTGYLHLSNFAKGIRQGTRVKQGQLIGYVGSTGLATGPHLDFRFWKNNSPVDPLKVESPTVEPIKKINQQKYDSIKTEMTYQLHEADSLLHQKHPQLKQHGIKN